MKNLIFKRNAILWFLFLIPFTLFAQRDTTKAITLDPSWILYCSHDLFFSNRYNLKTREYENYFADYGITVGIQKRASFNKRVGVRFGLNYVTNKIKYIPEGYSAPITILVHRQPAVIKYIISNYFQIPFFLEYKFVNTKKIEFYSALGLSVNFTIEGGIAEEQIIAEQNGKKVKAGIHLSPRLSLYSPLHHNIAFGINYRVNNKLKLNIEPICRIHYPTDNSLYYGPLGLGISTNIVYRFK